MMAEAPSLRVEEFPAVTTDPPVTTGRSPASTSMRGAGAGPFVGVHEVSPLRVLTVPGRSPSANRPASMAARARSWERTANASASSR